MLTLYAFSVENWKRPASEVSMLMMLLRRYLRSELSTLLENNIRFNVIGRRDGLAPEIQAELAEAERHTSRNSGLLFNIALNYGGRTEIVDAARAAMASGLAPGDLTDARFAEFLYTKGQPDPDLLIRTSGEMRISNFFLWQLAYTELYVTETLWPDFREQAFVDALVAMPSPGSCTTAIAVPNISPCGTPTVSHRRASRRRLGAKGMPTTMPSPSR